jgi:hypothetical protein
VRVMGATQTSQAGMDVELTQIKDLASSSGLADAGAEALCRVIAVAPGPGAARKHCRYIVYSGRVWGLLVYG